MSWARRSSATRVACCVSMRAAPSPYASSACCSAGAVAATMRPRTDTTTSSSASDMSPRCAPTPTPSMSEIRDSALSAAEAWVEGVAERVAQQVGAEDGKADGDTWEQHEVRGLLRVLRRRYREHASPRGPGLGHAEPEKREGRLGEDGASQLRR